MITVTRPQAGQANPVCVESTFAGAGGRPPRNRRRRPPSTAACRARQRHRTLRASAPKPTAG
ncbi:MAG: hypothetical protein MZV70_50870 [Desulfobacterales bacterium]|nr:hypothetical protein [Desulfobacterales bacterium]